MLTEVQTVNFQEDHFEDLDVDGRVILKRSLDKYGSRWFIMQSNCDLR
jgi:hypothetical protein